MATISQITFSNSFFNCDQAALRTLLSVCPLTDVMSMQQVRCQGHRGHNPI